MQSETETIAIGEACERIVHDETFKFVFEWFEKANFELFLRTRSDETHERERLYASINGVRDFINVFYGHVQAKDAILQTNEEQSNRDEAGSFYD